MSSGVKSLSLQRDRPDVSASVTQPIHLFVKNAQARAWKINNLNWESSTDLYRLDRLNIEFEARTIYFQLLLGLETIEIEKRKHASSRLVYKLAETRVKNRRLAASELDRASLTEQQDKRRIQNAETNYAQALNEAKDFILMPVDQEIDLTSQLAFSPVTLPLEKLTEVAMAENPTIRIIRRNVEQSEISLRQAREGNRPRFDMSGSFTKTVDQSAVDTDVVPYSWDARVDMSWPFFDASQTRLATQQGEASLRNTERTYESEARRLKISLENAWLDLKRVEGQIMDFAEQKKTAEQSLSSIRRQFEKGASDLTDVFESEETLRSLELEHLRLLVEFQNARDRLKVLVGKDLSEI